MFELFLQARVGLGLHPRNFGLHCQAGRLFGRLTRRTCCGFTTFFGLALRLFLCQARTLGLLARGLELRLEPLIGLTPQAGHFGLERLGGRAFRGFASLDDGFPVGLLGLALRLLVYRACGRRFDAQPLDLCLDLCFRLGAGAGDFIGERQRRGFLRGSPSFFRNLFLVSAPRTLGFLADAIDHPLQLTVRVSLDTRKLLGET